MPCLRCYFLGLSPWVKLLLLFSPIHWEKLFLFQHLAVHCIWCSAVLLPRLPAQRRNSTARISSKLQQSATIVTAMFSLCDAFLAFCFVLPLCRLCGEGGWPNSWPCGLFPELFTEFSTNLSDHCRVVADVALSQRLKLSQSLERCWGVQEWSVRWIVLHGVHQWHKDRRYHRKALPWPATRHMGVQHPPVLRCYTWGGEGLQAPIIEGRKLSQADGGCGSGRELSQLWVGLWTCYNSRWKSSATKDRVT